MSRCCQRLVSQSDAHLVQMRMAARWLGALDSKVERLGWPVEREPNPFAFNKFGILKAGPSRVPAYNSSSDALRAKVAQIEASKLSDSFCMFRDHFVICRKSDRIQLPTT
jgi:hypothetical protein